MLIKLSTAAKMLDIHKDSLRRYIRKGLVKGHQLPTGHWRVDDSDIKSITNKSIDKEVDDILAKLLT